MKGGIRIPLVLFESKVPVVKLNLGDREFFALVDTGSESTLMDRELAGVDGIKEQKRDSEMSFVGIQGRTEDRRISILRGKFQYEESEIRIAGISADLSTIGEHFKRSYGSDIAISMLLGCDLLEIYNAVVDFDEHMLYLYNKNNEAVHN